VPGLSTAGILLVMDSNDPVLEKLSRYECMRLMRSVPVGRIVYTRQALPAVELVNFTTSANSISSRSRRGRRESAITSSGSQRCS
jgi:hypothetical protein